MEIMNIDNLGNQLNYLENTKNLIMNSLIDKGQNITTNNTFRSYLNELNRLSNIRRFNTLDEMNLDTDSRENDLALVYGPYRDVKENDDITCIYFPKKINITKSQIEALPDQTILGYIVNKTDPTIEIMRAYINNNDIVIAFQDPEIYSTNIIYRLDENNIYTRVDNSNDYIEIPISDIYNITYTNPVREIYPIDFENMNDGYRRNPINVAQRISIERIYFTTKSGSTLKVNIRGRSDGTWQIGYLGNLNTELTRVLNMGDSNYKVSIAGYTSSDWSTTGTYNNLNGGRNWVEVKWHTRS